MEATWPSETRGHNPKDLNLNAKKGLGSCN